MTCANPIWLEKKHIEVPCGKCDCCIKARAAEWGLRVLHESSEYENNIFVTLTLDDENYKKENYQVNKNTAKKFIKRLRESLNGRKIKYFLCGEYGERYGRAHYHVILLNTGWSDEQNIKDCWTLGTCCLGTVTPESIHYVTGYMIKKSEWFLKNPSDDRERPFQSMSNGMGLKYALRHKDVFTDHLEVTIQGNKRALPKYYKNKLEISKEVLFEKAKQLKGEQYLRYQKKGIDINESDLRQAFYRIEAENYKNAQLRQKELNIKAKNNLKIRDYELLNI